MLAVEAAMRAYAPRYGGDPERWGLAGLLHDFDYERYPNEARSPTEEHPSAGVAHLRGLGYPEDVLHAILGHASFTGVARDTDMARVLFAVDELAGLVTAVALVKPGRSLAEVDVPSVRKKMKDKAFARGVNRADIVQGAEELGVDLDGHIQVVIDAMRVVAGDLGLAGA
jgi:predicted hydrolase (HD superfamily)